MLHSWGILQYVEMAINPNPLILEKIQNQKLDKRHLCAKIQFILDKSNFLS